MHLDLDNLFYSKMGALIRDTNKYYNPIKNDMPSWMPGSNYFIDFQHGDPYSKVPEGEMRLPGEA